MIHLLVVLYFSASLSTVLSKIVCRYENASEVRCPDDYFCCGVDQCCKLDFRAVSADLQQSSSKDTGGISLDEWVAALCVRIVAVAGCMLLLYAVGMAIRGCRKQCTAPGKCSCEENSLPKYKALDKNTIVSDIDNISVLMGTPFYQVNSERVAGLRSTFPID